MKKIKQLINNLVYVSHFRWSTDYKVLLNQKTGEVIPNIKQLCILLTYKLVV